MTITHPAAAPASADPLGLLDRGGEMGRLIRDADWSASPLGRPEGWPRALFDTLRLLLAALILWRHRANIARLLQGTEPRIGRR